MQEDTAPVFADSIDDLYLLLHALHTSRNSSKKEESLVQRLLQLCKELSMTPNFLIVHPLFLRLIESLKRLMDSTSLMSSVVMSQDKDSLKSSFQRMIIVMEGKCNEIHDSITRQRIACTSEEPLLASLTGISLNATGGFSMENLLKCSQDTESLNTIFQSHRDQCFSSNLLESNPTPNLKKLDCQSPAKVRRRGNRKSTSGMHDASTDNSKKLHSSVLYEVVPSSLSHQKLTSLLFGYCLDVDVNTNVRTHVSSVESCITRCKKLVPFLMSVLRLEKRDEAACNHPSLSTFLRSIIQEFISNICYRRSLRENALIAVAFLAFAVNSYDEDCQDALELTIWAIFQLSQYEAEKIHDGATHSQCYDNISVIKKEVFLYIIQSLASKPSIIPNLVRRLSSFLQHLQQSHQICFVDQKFMFMLQEDVMEEECIHVCDPPYAAHPIIQVIIAIVRRSMTTALNSSEEVSLANFIQHIRVVSRLNTVNSQGILGHVMLHFLLDAHAHYGADMINEEQIDATLLSPSLFLEKFGNLGLCECKQRWFQLLHDVNREELGSSKKLNRFRHFMQRFLLACNTWGYACPLVFNSLLKYCTILESHMSLVDRNLRAKIKKILFRTKVAFATLYLEGLLLEDSRDVICNWMICKFGEKPMSSLFILSFCVVICRKFDVDSSRSKFLCDVLCRVLKDIQIRQESVMYISTLLNEALGALRVGIEVSKGTMMSVKSQKLSMPVPTKGKQKLREGNEEMSYLHDTKDRFYEDIRNGKLSPENCLLKLLADCWSNNVWDRYVHSFIVCELICSVATFRIFARELLKDHNGQNIALNILFSQHKKSRLSRMNHFPTLQTRIENELYPTSANVRHYVNDISFSSLTAEMMLQSKFDSTNELTGRLISRFSCGFLYDYVGKTFAIIHALRSDIDYFVHDGKVTGSSSDRFFVFLEGEVGEFRFKKSVPNILRENVEIMICSVIIYAFRWHLFRFLSFEWSNFGSKSSSQNVEEENFLMSSKQNDETEALNHFMYILACAELFDCFGNEAKIELISQAIDCDVLRFVLDNMNAQGDGCNTKWKLLMSCIAWMTRYVKLPCTTEASLDVDVKSTEDDKSNVWLWLNLLPLYAICTTCILSEELAFLCQTLQGDIISFVQLCSACMESCLRGITSKSIHFRSLLCVERLMDIGEFSITASSRSAGEAGNADYNGMLQSSNPFSFSVYTGDNSKSEVLIKNRIDFCLVSEDFGLFHICADFEASYLDDEDRNQPSRNHNYDECRMLLPTYDQIQKVKHSQHLSRFESHVYASRCYWDPFSKLATEITLSPPCEKWPVEKDGASVFDVKALFEHTSPRDWRKIDGKRRQRSISSIKKSRSSASIQMQTAPPLIHAEQHVGADLVEDPPEEMYADTKEIDNTHRVSCSPPLSSTPSTLKPELARSSPLTAFNSSEKRKEKWEEKTSSAVDIAKKFGVNF